MDRLMTLVMPSALQKRPEAKGRSAEMTRATASSRPAMVSLNFLVEAAQTPVSRLGTMLSNFFLPA